MRFGYRKVFSDITFEVGMGGSLAITGPNGAGKSTLVMTLLSLYTPSKGKVLLHDDHGVLDDDSLRSQIGFVAPYLQLYDHLTAEENLKFLSVMFDEVLTGKTVNELLERVGLKDRGGDRVGHYSSGMKQRLKYAVALMGNPIFLFLDEPSANLDQDGRRMVKSIIDERRQNSITVIATNESEEISLAEKECRLTA